MTLDRWHHIKHLFEEALDRERFLAQACDGDQTLRTATFLLT